MAKYIKADHYDNSILWRGQHGAGSNFETGRLALGADQDGEAHPISTSKDGDLATIDPAAWSLLQEILIELKKINLHLEAGSDSHITEQDVSLED